MSDVHALNPFAPRALRTSKRKKKKEEAEKTKFKEKLKKRKGIIGEEEDRGKENEGNEGGRKKLRSNFGRQGRTYH
jgi:hypothetical protein